MGRGTSGTPPLPPALGPNSTQDGEGYTLTQFHLGWEGVPLPSPTLPQHIRSPSPSCILYAYASCVYISEISDLPEASPIASSLNYIEDDELLEEEASELEDDPEFDPDLFLWKKSSMVHNELDFSSGTFHISSPLLGAYLFRCVLAIYKRVCPYVHR